MRYQIGIKLHDTKNQEVLCCMLTKNKIII